MTSIGNLWLTTVSLGFDSFVAAFFIGPMIVSWRWRAGYATLFGVCDGLATLLGAAMPHRLPEPPAAVLYLLCVMLIIKGARESRAWLFATPVLLSLDNLGAGATAAAAPVLALGSAAMAAAGFALGALGRRAARWADTEPGSIGARHVAARVCSQLGEQVERGHDMTNVSAAEA